MLNIKEAKIEGSQFLYCENDTRTDEYNLEVNMKSRNKTETHGPFRGIMIKSMNEGVKTSVFSGVGAASATAPSSSSGYVGASQTFIGKM